MKRFVCLGLAVLIFFGLLGSLAFGESVMICTSTVLPGGIVEKAYGTGVAIASTERGSLIVTCRHNVEDNPSGIWIYHRHDWHLCGRASLHEFEDIAAFESPVRFKSTPLCDAVPLGESVRIEGAGPSAHGRSGELAFGGTLIDEQTIEGAAGKHAILGDSGGPVLCWADADRLGVAGIVTAVEGSDPPSRRDEFPGRRTRYVSCRKIVAWMQTQYGGCPGGVCPIQIRPRVVQPMIGIGIPTGPPRIIGEAVPVRPAPIYVPAPQQPVTPRPVPDPAFTSGPAGPRGERGPQGEPGPAGRSVTKAEVEACVNAWLEANIDRINGPPGERVNVDALDARVKILEDRKIRIITSDGSRIVDDESYDVNAGEPVVLEIRKLTAEK